MQIVAYIISFLVIGIFSAYYFVVRAFPIELNYINSVIAFSSTFIIAITALLGPLARFFSKQLRSGVKLRRPLGIIGFGLAALHTALVVPILLQESREITFGDAVSMAFAAIAFMIFTLMALTSTSQWLEKLGYENWKRLQRLGYLALIFVIFHVVLLEKGVFLERTTGRAAIIIVLLAILLRILSILGKEKEAYSREEIISKF